jgi:sugar transferase (PEP-CTERM/EpsH1 system associated)
MPATQFSQERNMRSRVQPTRAEVVAATSGAPLIAHVIYGLKTGGVENGLVNLINHMPAERYRHAIVCLTDYSDFRLRIRRADVECYALHKPPGKVPGFYVKVWKLLCRLRPHIVHTRNLTTLATQVPAMLAGAPMRIHGEHGRDMVDLDGSNVKYQRVRRLIRPFVHQYIALSQDLERYLVDKIGVAPQRLTQIYNGVDTELFHPARSGRGSLPVTGFAGSDTVVIGTVGRMQEVKDQLTLVRAFVGLLQLRSDLRDRLRLVIIGDGALRAPSLDLLEQAGALDLAWLPGERTDIPELMRGLDVFVLPSLAEGISNTILEAMATGLPIVATRVGGNPELVEEGHTALLVPADDPQAMAAAIAAYADDAGKRAQHGAAARVAAEARFSLEAMVRAYMGLYDRVLNRQ